MIKQGTVFLNGSRWSSPRTDELMNMASVEPDHAKRIAYYTELQKLTVEAAPIIWVLEVLYPTVINKRYKDVIVTPLGLYGSYSRAWLDR
jgi:peptide/nickel transport system substrate-binding protein